jgi:hypothetical protein
MILLCEIPEVHNSYNDKIVKICWTIGVCLTASNFRDIWTDVYFDVKLLKANG